MLQKDQLEEASLPKVCSLSLIKDNTTEDWDILHSFKYLSL